MPVTSSPGVRFVSSSGCLRRQAVKIAQWKAPLSQRPEHLDLGVQRRQRDGQIRGVGRDAGRACTEQGGLAILAGERATAGARAFACCRQALRCENTGSGFAAADCRRPSPCYVFVRWRWPGSPCDQRMISRHIGMGGDIAQPGKRPQRELSIDKFHIIQRQARDVDDRCGRDRTGPSRAGASRFRRPGTRCLVSTPGRWRRERSPRGCIETKVRS